MTLGLRLVSVLAHDLLECDIQVKYLYKMGREKKERERRERESRKQMLLLARKSRKEKMY